MVTILFAANVVLLANRHLNGREAAELPPELPTRVSIAAAPSITASSSPQNTHSQQPSTTPPLLETPLPQANPPSPDLQPAQQRPVNLETQRSAQPSVQAPQPPAPLTSPIDRAVEAAIARDGQANVIIMLDSATPADLLSAVGDEALQEAQTFAGLGAVSGVLTPEGLAALRANEAVVRVYIDQPVEAFGDVTEADLQAAADTVRSLRFNNTDYTGEGVQVAVVDTGVDTTRIPAVAEQCFIQPINQPISGPVNPGGCIVSVVGSNITYAESSNNADPEPVGSNPRSLHGTNVAAIIAGPEGVAPDAGVVAVRVLDRYGRGLTSDWIRGLNWIADQNASGALSVDVVNLSLGSAEIFSDATACVSGGTSLETQVIDRLRSQNVIVVAATGNQGRTNGISAPACLPGVIAVGAVYDPTSGAVPRQPATGTYYQLNGGAWPSCYDLAPAAGSLNDQVACFTNSNPLLDVLAPGVAITARDFSTNQNGTSGATQGTGTSQAAPHVAGVAALMREAVPTLQPDRTEGIFRYTGIPVRDTRSNLIFRRVDPQQAVEQAVAAEGRFIGCFDPRIVNTVGQDECEALVALYESTSGPNWLDKGDFASGTEWVASPAPCTWRGVICDGDYNVLGLELSNNGLSGTLPTELIDLTALQTLNLRGNGTARISGSIPPLPSTVITLDISFNNFSGNIRPLPTSLVTFNARGNNLTGNIPTLPAALKSFDVGENRLNGSLPAALPPTMTAFLADDNRSLSGALPALPNGLVELDLTGARLTGNIPTSLPSALEVLRIPNTIFNYAGLGGTLPALPAGLVELDISFHNISGTISAFPAGLIELNIRANALSGSLPPLPNGLSGLIADGNNFSGSIPPFPSTLILAYLYSNNFSGGFPDISQSTYLNRLLLSDNNLEGDIPDLSTLGLFQLQWLILSRNHFEGSFPSLPPTITVLWLDYNQFSGPLPVDLGQRLPNLDDFVIRNNYFSGEVPASITELSGLEGILCEPVDFSADCDVKLYFNRFAPTNPDVVAWLNLRNPEWETTQLLKPIGLTAIALNANSVRLNWASPAFTANGFYEVWGNFDNNAPELLARTGDAATTQIVVGGLFSGIDYTFQIRLVYDAFGEEDDLFSEFSDPAQTTPPILTTFCQGEAENGISLEECLALQVLYNSTGGDTWTTNTRWQEVVDTRLLVTANEDAEAGNTFSILNAESGTGTSSDLPDGDLLDVDAVRFSRDGNRVAFAGNSGEGGTIRVLNLSTRQEVTLTNLGLPSDILDWDYNGDWMLIEALGESRFLYTYRFNNRFGIFDERSTLVDVEIDDVDISPDGDNFVIVNGDGLARIYELETLDIVNEINLPTTSFTSVDYGPDDNTILIGEADSPGSDLALVWLNAETQDTTVSVPQTDSTVVDVAFSPAGTHLLTTSNTQLVLWNWNGTEATENQRFIAPGFDRVEFSGDGSLFYSISGNFMTVRATSQPTVVLYNFLDARGGAAFNPIFKQETYLPCGWIGVSCFGGHVNWLALPNNNLTGTIPPQISLFTDLVGLNLSNNALTGFIPSEIGNLSELTYLELNDNALIGSIPEELGNSPAADIRLQNNRLSGNIPDTLGQQGTMVSLVLSSNQLTWENPGALFDAASVENLRWLDLSNNLLTGPLPPEIGNLARMENFSITGNALTGPIPAEIGQMGRLSPQGLRFLSLEFVYDPDDPAGPLPPEIGNLTTLTNLSITGLNVPGPIPDSYQNLTQLSVLRLASNQINGSLPEWIGNNNLEFLNVSDNLLTGNIPDSIVNIVLGGSGDMAFDTLAFSVNNNLLFETNPAVIAFLDGRNPGWQSTQTVAPTNAQVDVYLDPPPAPPVSADVRIADETQRPATIVNATFTWNPAGAASQGYYEVVCAPTQNDLLNGTNTTVIGRTANRSETTLSIEDLTPQTTLACAVRSVHQSALDAALGQATTASAITPDQVLQVVTPGIPNAQGVVPVPIPSITQYEPEVPPFVPEPNDSELCRTLEERFNNNRTELFGRSGIFATGRSAIFATGHSTIFATGRSGIFATGRSAIFATTRGSDHDTILIILKAPEDENLDFYGAQQVLDWVACNDDSDEAPSEPGEDFERPGGSAAYTSTIQFDVEHNLQDESDDFDYYYVVVSKREVGDILFSVFRQGEAPILSLLGDDPLLLDVFTPLNDPGATAFDVNAAGEQVNLTDSIIVDTSALNTSVIGTYEVVYTVRDDDNNVRSLRRAVQVVDRTAPVLTLAGESTLTVPFGQPYTDPGGSAVDNYDGDLSAQIVINSDAVNVNLPGTYIVALLVRDSSGNETVAERTVIVSEPGENVAPDITVEGEAVTVVLGEQAQNTGLVEDANGDGYTLTASLGTITDNGNGTWSWTYTPATTGEFNVVLTATDAQGAANSVSFMLYVNAGLAQRITGFMLVDASTGADIAPLPDGGVIDLFANPNYTIRTVNTSNYIGSVRFGLNDQPNYRTENGPPYTLAGDQNGVFGRLNLAPGTYRLSATNFSRSNATGENLGTRSITFQVVNQGAVSSWQLYNAQTDTLVGPLTDGAVINLATLPQFNIAVIPQTARVGSIRFGLNNNPAYRTENGAPYLAGGDENGNIYPLRLGPGVYRLTATAYSRANAQGTAGTPTTITFSVINALANAGVDQVHTDTDGDGFAPVTLDAGLSMLELPAETGLAADVVQVQWMVGDVIIGTGASTSVMVPVGTHTITLLLVLPDGQTTSDTLTLVVQPFVPPTLTPEPSLTPSLTPTPTPTATATATAPPPVEVTPEVTPQ
ncbi:MAG: S8 family serine peptidase [bacterium]|nr:S8 family serine peptidase [bacterium]